MKTAAIIIAIVIVAGTGIYLASRSGNNGTGSSDDTYDTIPQDQISGASGLDTQGNERGVMLESLNMPESGFIVIHTDSNGQPGDVVGFSPLLQSGDNRNVQVPGGLVPGQGYFVSAYADSNGNGIFDANDDQPITDDDGNKMTQRFTAPQAGNANNINPSNSIPTTTP